MPQSWLTRPAPAEVDVHCHLEDVVQEIRRRQAVPSLNKKPRPARNYLMSTLRVTSVMCAEGAWGLDRQGARIVDGAWMDGGRNYGGSGSRTFQPRVRCGLACRDLARGRHWTQTWGQLSVSQR